MIIEDGIKISHYKCFGQEGKGFDKIFPINIIIGKNNSGKSTLIDIIQYLMDIEKFKRVELRNGEKCNLIIKTKLTQDHIKTIPASTQGGGIPGPSHHQYAQGMLGKEFQYYVVNEHERKMLAPENFFMTDALKYIANIERSILPPFYGKNFYRITAERDIVPEIANNNGIVVAANGAGATNLIRQIINWRQFNRDIIEIELLNVLNKIVQPDISFTRIAVEESDDSTWQIYFRDEENNHIGLSSMGSGVKTILLVVLHLITIPRALKRPYSDFVFAFEELENNLHPSILRRLFYFIIEFSETNGVYFFITTHSSIVIDLFGDYAKSQIIHVQKRNVETSVTTITDMDTGRHILKDLDFRPSDLLLSNGIIWVEGPSDAIIIELFLNMFRKHKGFSEKAQFNYTIQSLATALWKYAGFEGVDWQQLSSDHLQNKIIALEKVNHNHLLVIDNDNNYEDMPPSRWESFSQGTGQNKARLISASMKYANYSEADLESNFGDAKGDKLFFWVNEGTLESYLEYFITHEGSSFAKYFEFSQQRRYFEKKRSGDQSSKSKVELASEIAQYFYKKDLSIEDVAPTNSSLFNKIERLYNTILSWNYAR